MNITEELTSPNPSSRGKSGRPGHLAARDDLRALRKREWTVLALLLATVTVAYFNVKRIVVHGVSMQPTFKSSQSVFVWTSVRRSSLRRGDIIVFRSPDGDEYIKRIVFIQNANGSEQPPEDVWTTDGPQPFEYLFESFYKDGKDIPGTRPVDDRTIWVMGDNYQQSKDSRDFGPISPKSILGKVMM
jgi:signal peptidase I